MRPYRSRSSLSQGLNPPFTDPRTSEEAKQHAREVLAEEEEEEAHPEQSSPVSAHDRHTKRVLGGYKAALRSTLLGLTTAGSLVSAKLTSWLSIDTNVSQEAKDRAREILKEAGEEV